MALETTALPTSIAASAVSTLPAATETMVGLGASTPAAVVEQPDLAVTPEPATSVEADVETGPAATEESAAETAETTESDTPSGAVAIKDGNKAVPGVVQVGVTGEASSGAPAAAGTKPALNSLRDQVTSTLAKFGIRHHAGEKDGAAADATGADSDSDGNSDE
jgi:hypothetical protein